MPMTTLEILRERFPFWAVERLQETALKIDNANNEWQPPARTLQALCLKVHEANKTWWHDPATGVPIERNVGELLCLVHSEISEAMEGHRKNLPDDKLPHRTMFEVELADALIRIFDIAGGMNLDLGGAFEEKMAYNAQRADHKPENRIKPGGKAY